MHKIKKYITLFAIILIVFICGVSVGNKITYKPSIYNKYYTDKTTGVQYIVVVSKDGGVAIFPRLNSDGTIRTKNKIVFVANELKGETNEQTNFNGNQ